MIRTRLTYDPIFGVTREGIEMSVSNVKGADECNKLLKLESEKTNTPFLKLKNSEEISYKK